VNRAEAHQSEGGLISLYHFTLEWLRRNSALIPCSLLRGASLFPFNLVSNKFIMDHVGEFMSPNFHDLYAKLFEFLLILTLIVLSISKKVCPFQKRY